MPIEVGLVHETRRVVGEADTAASSGGEKLPKVLSTPRMISWMEGTAHMAVVPFLGPDQTSVGTVVNIRHLAATPPGMEVRVTAELLQVDGRRLLFRVEAWDAVEKIGEGEHERFIIDCERFTSRLEKKKAENGLS